MTYCQKLDNLDEIDKFLERHESTNLTQEAVENRNKFITRRDIELVIKKHPKNKPKALMSSMVKFSKCLKKN